MEKTSQADRVGPLLEAAVPGLALARWTRTDVSPQVVRYAGWGSIPVQIDGTLNGRPFYFRYRGDRAFLSVWAEGTPFTPGDQLPDGQPDLQASVLDLTGDPVCGWLADEQVVPLFTRLVEALAPVDAEVNPTYSMVLTKELESIRFTGMTRARPERTGEPL